MSPHITRISRYEIKGLIAEGGMGELYLARDPNTDRLVALKLLNATVDSEDLRQRFEREAQALAALSHPNIVHIYDHGDFQSAPFIVMEYVRGETLAEQIKRRTPMPTGQKLKLMVELCSGLDHAHNADIVHRDVKPANLMVDLDGRLRILDFGIARFAESSMTRIGSQGSIGHMQIGTPGYMSPEQMAGGEIDRRADVFAVGAVCYEFLSGREAFSGSNVREIQKKIADGPAVPLSTLVPDIDPELDQIIKRALAGSPADRFQDAASLGEALDAQRAKLGSADPAKPRATPPPPGSGRRSPAMRADAAYQRAADIYKDGSLEAARRYALEALAEDPEHAGAHALMARLARDRRPATGPLVVQPPTTSVRVAPSTAVGGPAKTVTPPRTAASPIKPASAFTPSSSEPSYDETVLIRPPAKPAPPPAVPAADETVMIPRAAAPVVRREPPAPAYPPSSQTMAPRREQPAPAPRPPAASPSRPQTAFPASREEAFPTSDETILIPRSAPASRPASAFPSAPPAPPPRDLSSLIPDDQTVLIPRTPRSDSGGRTGASSSPLSNWPSTSSAPVASSSAPSGASSSSAAPAPKAPARSGTATKSSSKRSQPRPGKSLALLADAKALWAQYGRTGQIVAGIFLVGVLAIAGILMSGLFGSSGNRLTIRKPTGGTISANGIKCGSLGGECSATFGKGDQVELQVQADAGYVFEGYLDDCAPTGRLTMSADMNCSATFNPVPEGPKGGLEWPLTIERPTGGSVLSVGITCGSLGSQCTASFPNGVPVTLHTKADPGWAFLKFSDACGPSGEITMSSARNCTAIFVQATASAPDKGGAPQVIAGGNRRPAEPGGLPGLVGGGSGSAGAGRTTPEPASGAATTPGSSGGGSAATPDPPAGGGAAQRATGGGAATAPPPITEEQHAKNAILTVLKDYCAAVQAMNAEKVHDLYQRESVASLKNKYNSYKSTKCSVVGDPDYKVLEVVAGNATVEIGMKQVLEKKVGNAAPEVSETIATIVLLRPQQNTDWRISTMVHRKKPKE